MKELSKFIQLSQFVIFVYVTTVISVFYNDLKSGNKILNDVDLDATGITTLTLMGILIILSFYNIYSSFSS